MSHPKPTPRVFDVPNALAGNESGTDWRVLYDIQRGFPDRDMERPPRPLADDMAGVRALVVAMVQQAWNDAQGLTFKVNDQDIEQAKLWLLSPACLEWVEWLGWPVEAFRERVREVA